VAKGLWRKEILYAQEHLNNYVRPMLIRMLGWQVGIETDFSVSIGKCGKYLERYLTDKSWQFLLSTCAGGSYSGTWDALLAACSLFRSTAGIVAAHFGYEYPSEDDKRVTEYLKHVRELPPDVQEIY
jgi:aminoglycoside 6-adenylyltransferase